MIIKHQSRADENGKQELTDITKLVTRIEWSGSRLQAARRLQFDMIQDTRDPNLPNHPIDNGETIFAYDEDGNLRFQGNVYRIEKDVQQSKLCVTAYDNLFILNKSKTTRKFDSMAAEDIIRVVCGELGIKVGEMVSMGVPVSFIAVRKSGYQIILMALTETSKKTDKKYAAVMKGDTLSVIEKGTLVEGYAANAFNNVLNGHYSESIEDMVNQVMITDAEGNVIGYQSNDDQIQKYSMIQDVYKSSPKANAQEDIKTMLKGPDRAGVIECLGNYDVMAPYSIQIQEQLFKGQFWIKSDTHIFEGGIHVMKLELEFENLMTEEEAGHG